ncbi:MAG TPA: adenylyltransferase/cytidyltransferase family protein [Candidatus Paceibacterota bacterium]|nr:adenylyltransferase/cytidyltransferase family protein [Candidatus Paceibacterota bacterium]
MISRTVTIFGVFDGIHDGHNAFINDAKEQGDRLIAIVARDEVVKKLKGKLPIHNEVERIKALLEVPEIDSVFLGDKDEGAYNIIKEIKPDIIFLGYDQQKLFNSITLAMKKNILSKNIKLIFGKPHKSDTHHSSILNKK